MTRTRREDYHPGRWTVTSWNERSGTLADERLVYVGDDVTEAVRVFEGLARWKRRGLVQLVGPTGLVSIVCRQKDPAKNWATRFAHPPRAPGDHGQCEATDIVRTEDDGVEVRCTRLGRCVLEGMGHGGKRLRFLCGAHGLTSSYEVN